MFYDVRNNCSVCGNHVDGVGNATICTFCYNNNPQLHYQDCPCLSCQRKRETTDARGNEIKHYGKDEEPVQEDMPYCACGTQSVPNHFYGFWCPQCKNYPDFTPPQNTGVMGTKYQTWEELHTMWGIPQ